MISRVYIIGMTIAYFWLWGHYSRWDLHFALYHDWYVTVLGLNGVGAFLRLGFGLVLLLASAASLMTIESKTIR